MLNINLEPVYAMIMAAALYPDERMSGAFYLGAAIILSVVVLNAWLNNLPSGAKPNAADPTAGRTRGRMIRCSFFFRILPVLFHPK